MPRSIGEPIRGALQSLLGFDHSATGKALLTPTILPERDHLGHPLYGRHHCIELVLPIAMPMHEHREVAIGERRWLVRDRVQRETWTGEQFVAIGSGDLAVLVHALTVEARHRHRSAEHTSELPSLMRISYAVFCLKNTKNQQ